MSAPGRKQLFRSLKISSANSRYAPESSRSKDVDFNKLKDR